MKRLLAPALLIATLALVPILAVPAHAGWGDAIKAKAAKALKAEKPKPATEAGPITSRIATEVTAERLARFQRGLETEVAERQKGMKFLATLRTPEAYGKCKSELAASKEVQDLTMTMVNLPENAKPEEMQRHMQKMGLAMDSMTTSKCGPDPSQYSAGQIARDAIGKGTDTAALGDGYEYDIWKEWIIEFCSYIEKLEKQSDAKQQLAKIQDEGLRIPGTSAGIYYVYTASEATLLIERCPALKPLLEATL
jgi:hypothetical protein